MNSEFTEEKRNKNEKIRRFNRSRLLNHLFFYFFFSHEIRDPNTTLIDTCTQITHKRWTPVNLWSKTNFLGLLQCDLELMESLKFGRISNYWIQPKNNRIKYMKWYITLNMKLHKNIFFVHLKFQFFDSSAIIFTYLTRLMNIAHFLIVKIGKAT